MQTTPNIEVEIRSFISPDKYQELLTFFHQQGNYVNEDYQETFYFDAEQDLRIQRNNTHSKIWLKKGKLHDEHREEIEIKFDKEHFELLEKLFLTLGYNTQIKWFRKRHTFDWQGIKVMLDYTKGYGYIIELEKMSSEQEKAKALHLLKEKLQQLNLPLSSKEEFEAKYRYYKEHWKKLIVE
jgi:predicted adenylyl cyclase CyaB